MEEGTVIVLTLISWLASLAVPFAVVYISYTSRRRWRRTTKSPYRNLKSGFFRLALMLSLMTCPIIFLFLMAFEFINNMAFQGFGFDVSFLRLFLKLAIVNFFIIWFLYFIVRHIVRGFNKIEQPLKEGEVKINDTLKHKDDSKSTQKVDGKASKQNSRDQTKDKSTTSDLDEK